MKVIHLWDAAGVGGTLIKYLRKYHNLEVPYYVRQNRGMPGLNAFYGANDIGGKFAWYMARVLLACRPVDIIHVHNFLRFAYTLRRFFPRKKIVYHDHGVGWTSPLYTRQKYEQAVDKILLAINNLQDVEYSKPAEFLPNPIDIDHFKPHKIPANNRGRIIVKGGMVRRFLVSYLEEQGYDHIDWDFVQLSGSDDMRKKVPYVDLPAHLATYEYIGDIDMRHMATAPFPLYNMTGLQAMAVGCKTICYDGMHDSIPPQHHPKVVTDRLMQIYREVYES